MRCTDGCCKFELIVVELRCVDALVARSDRTTNCDIVLDDIPTRFIKCVGVWAYLDNLFEANEKEVIMNVCHKWRINNSRIQKIICKNLGKIQMTFPQKHSQCLGLSSMIFAQTTTTYIVHM